jgi:hypothetical protein
MRYLTSAVQAWIDEDRELRANAELALHTQDPKKFAQDSAALLAMLQHAQPGTHYVLHVRNAGEALLVKQ